MDTTHDGRIGTDETMQPGYVWYRCDAYGLPDNTRGKIGYHVVYRPLCGTMYQGGEAVTKQMMADTREHYALLQERKAAFDRDLEAIRNYRPSPMDRAICPHCGTVCYGDCRS